MDEVVVYQRPGCPYCATLRLKLRMSRTAYRTVDIWADREAAALVRSVNGGDETVPTVAVGGRYLTNPSLRRLRAARSAS